MVRRRVADILQPHTAALVAALCLNGCPPKQIGALPAGPTPGHPSLQCPAGTFPAGFGPPAGVEAWCAKLTASGTTVREGPSIVWHTNEQHAAEGNWVDGKQNGAWLAWYPTGTPESQGSFAMGNKEGTWITFHPNGERAGEGAFVAGQEHGPWIFWNVDTPTRSEGEYVLGGRDGVWLDYGPDDRATRERIYRNGRLVTQREL